jgi:hypothetical protein
MHIREEQKQERLQSLTEAVLTLAERVGNMRVDGVTVGLSGDISDRSGFLVAVLRGQFDRVAFAQLVTQLGTNAGNVDGTDVFQPDNESAMFFATDNQAIYMAAPAGTSMPLKEVVAAVKTGKAGLERAEGIRALIKAAPTDQALWLVAHTTPEIRQFPQLSGFDTATLVGRQDGPTFQFQLSAQGTDPKKLELSMQELNRQLKITREWFESNAPVMPPLKPVRNFLRSIKPDVQGAKLTATATYQGPLTETIVFLEYPYATAKPIGDDGKPIEDKLPRPTDAEPAPAPAK